MQRAKMKVETILFHCPYCKEIIPSKSGSHFWTIEEIPKGYATLKCQDCKRESSIPIKAQQL